MSQPLPRPHSIELAPPPRRAWPGSAAAERIARHVARSDGYLESAGLSFASGAYALFDDMEEKDPHLHSILQTRKYGVLARGRKVEPASPSRQDLEAAAWIERALHAIPNFEAALLHLLDSLAKGMAVLEVIWGYDAEGRIVLRALKPRAAGRFEFEDGGGLRLADGEAAGFAAEREGAAGDSNRGLREVRPAPLSSIAGGRPALGRPLPARKFIVMLFGATDERPYGRGLCERVYWNWWFKKVTLKFWVIFNERFGSPTVVARHEAGLSQAERDRLLEVIDSLQADTGVTLPEGIRLELLESGRRNSSETFRELAAWCNDEMARAVLGQTLTVSAGREGGSFALGKVHEAVRFDYVRADAALLMDAVNGQLVRWIADFNLGESSPAPRWTIDVSPDLDAELELAIDRQLIRMGVPLPLAYFYSRYNRPPVGEGERSLRYDDNNLFQYHLQFGVLTVNEVRATLGLPPLAGGDRPTSPAGSPANPPAPQAGAAGDAQAEERESESESDADKDRDLDDDRDEENEDART